jgi:hypothetical protein
MSHPHCSNLDCQLRLLGRFERIFWPTIGGLFVLLKPTYGPLKLLWGGGIVNATEVLVFSVATPLVAIGISIYLVARQPISDRWTLILASLGTPGFALGVLSYFARLLVKGNRMEEPQMTLQSFTRGWMFVLTCCCGGSLAFAQDTKAFDANGLPTTAKTMNAIQNGEYFEFTPWQKIRLGATSLVNPETAQKADIVYVYQPKWTHDTDLADFVLKELKSGEMKVGTFDGTKVVVDDEKTEEFVRAVKEEGFISGLDAKVVLLSKDKIPASQTDALNPKSADKWIAWQ